MVQVFIKKSRRVEVPAEAKMPLPATWADMDCLISPRTKTEAFAQVSELKYGRTVLAPAGPLYLRCGLHLGANWGFGFRHIHEEHFKHIADRDEAAHVISAFVARLAERGERVLYNPENQEPDRLKAHILRVHSGLLVIEYRPEVGAYSVVTGFVGGQNTKGSQVGALV